MLLCVQNAGYARGTEWETGFQFLHDLINRYSPAQKPQAGRSKPFVRIVSGFTSGSEWQQLCALSGSVKHIYYHSNIVVS